MKLAFLLFNYFPYGGLQRDFLRIAQACRRRGHEIHVYTMRWEGEPVPGLTVHLVPVKGWQNHTRIQSFIQQVGEALKQQACDLVVGFNKMPHLDLYYAADVCYQARIREQRSWWYRLLPRYRYYQAWEEAVFARGQKTEIMLISALQQPAFARYYQTESARFHLLPPGIAQDRVVSIRQVAHSEPNAPFILVMVGSGFKTKGLDRAIRGLAALPPALKNRCYFLVIGQDNPAPFKKLAQSLQVADKLFFLGGRADVPLFLQTADVLVHPAYHENTGTVLLEAMISGLPVLTVETCGYAHYVREAHAGIVLPAPFDQAAFNMALEKMLTSSARQQWQQNGLAFAKTADIYSMPEKAADLIERKARSDITLDFAAMMALRGECFRHQKGRLTQRVQLGAKNYFVKQHHGAGWKEIIKNVLQGRWPVLSAENEKRAIEKLRDLDIAVPVVAAYDSRGKNPACIQSYILLEELTETVSLEDLCKTWKKSPPSPALKRELITEVARIARVMHENGVNHRDFYICHFLLSKSDNKLYLIDLHRAQIRQRTPERWIIKDLAGLYFSSMDSGLTRRDLCRFMRLYGKKDKAFWQKVKQRGEQLYHDHAK